MQTDYNINYGTVQEDIARVQQAFLTRVYGWMMLGLFLTAASALITVSSVEIMQLVFSSKLTFYMLIFAQLGLVLFLSARIQKIQASTAVALFIGYSLLTGVTMSSIFFIYTAESIGSVFVVTALTFGAMAGYGYFTKRDLTGVGSFMMMGLFGVIIASVVNIFMGSDSLSWLISFLCVIIFTGLTAYDTQKMKAMSYVMMEGREIAVKGAIIGALQLYLDFINLFLALLRLLGNRK